MSTSTARPQFDQEIFNADGLTYDVTVMSEQLKGQKKAKETFAECNESDEERDVDKSARSDRALIMKS